MLSDPIVALATPAGRSALAVIRLSGTGALEIAARVVSSRGPREAGASRLAGIPDRVATLAVFCGPDGAAIDQGLVTIFRGPRSYTGEDLVELSCHGGLLAPAELLAALHAAGARPAAPGEFTRRALLNGKLDLLQAEAIGDLIDATAPAQGRAALHQLDGGLSRRIAELREQAVELLALLAYDIDFPEEDDGPVPRGRIRAAHDALARQVGLLLATAPAGERLREGALVVLAGRPNAGKSSLFNALLGVNRALVTEIPGTTRDTIEAHTALLGWPVRLADTAGLRESEEPIERLGIEVSRRYLGAADLVLLCVEAGRALTAEERQLQRDRGALLVRSKADLLPAGQGDGEEGLAVSVVTGRGLDAVARGIAERLFDGRDAACDFTPMLTRGRHRVSLERATAALGEAGPHVEEGGDPVLAAHHIQAAVAELDELIGIVHPDEVLGRVFERFCVGK
ncbi:MAG TPA: tRNA uridine-5-carboxymethylaminomethyl(34) synthesis GTPase MnmE [Gemmatimonadales bacterium]|jgi:tRNA modification GTPase|nr:tRNA uridine-5-carboxymethylaminomethyl(34) synthesis GTPase MnmE [Gemmatimonadales bacterium]